MKHILVPVRFEEASEQLVTYAGAMARAFGAELVLLYYTTTRELTFTQQSIAMQALRTFADHHLHKYSNKCFKRFECVVRPGSLAESIKSVVQDYGVDLVLMQASAESADDTSPDHAASIMQQVEVPVMVLPEGRTYRPLRHLVFATDFTDQDPKVLGRIRNFAEQAQAQLTLVQIYTLTDKPQLSTLNKAMREVGSLLQSDNVQLRLLEEEDMLEGISDFAEREGADMLVMATQDSYLMQRLFSNAYVKTRAYHTQIPLLTYRQVKRKPCSGCCTNCKSKVGGQALLLEVEFDSKR